MLSLTQFWAAYFSDELTGGTRGVLPGCSGANWASGKRHGYRCAASWSASDPGWPSAGRPSGCSTLRGAPAIRDPREKSKTKTTTFSHSAVEHSDFNQQWTLSDESFTQTWNAPQSLSPSSQWLCCSLPGDAQHAPPPVTPQARALSSAGPGPRHCQGSAAAKRI